MTSLIGIIALVLLSTAAIPQVVRTLKDGHCNGMSWGYLILLQLGFISMAVYVIMTQPMTQPLLMVLINYFMNIIMFGIMIFRKAFPRSSSPTGRGG